jgi:hypothetical protein
MRVAVWSDSPNEASTGAISKGGEIETFLITQGRPDKHQCRSIMTPFNPFIMKYPLISNVSYTGVGLGGANSLLSASAASISAILLPEGRSSIPLGITIAPSLINLPPTRQLWQQQ